MSEGRGAWTLRGKRNYSNEYVRKAQTPVDGTYPASLGDEEQAWYDSVHSGVLTIQGLLVDKGFLPERLMLERPGEFTFAVRHAARDFQASVNLRADGYVGMQTMKAMLSPTIRQCSHEAGVNPKWIYALARQESAFDPGAQGWTTPADYGVFQFNTSLGTVTINEAFDLDYAAPETCRRFATALEHFDGKGNITQIDCAILQHRAPTAAQTLYDTGDTDEEMVDYIESVRDFAAEWV